MNRLVLALATMTVFSTPVPASYPRVHEEMEARHGLSKDAYRHASHMARLRQDVGSELQPYWAPCDYTTTADPNGCE
jgi:hypothetical protein